MERFELFLDTYADVCSYINEVGFVCLRIDPNINWIELQHADLFLLFFLVHTLNTLIV